MGLIKKRLQTTGRTLYLYFPKGAPRTPFRRCSITVLRDGSDEKSVRDLLTQGGLADLAEEKQLILAFPNPRTDSWDFKADADDLLEMQDSMATSQPEEPAEKWVGIPTLDMMLNTWHPMNDTKYMIGLGSGASMALAMAACRPQMIAALLAIGGSLPADLPEPLTHSAVPTWLCGADEATLSYFLLANEANHTEPDLWECPFNPLQRVVRSGESRLTPELANRVWAEMFSKTRRTNTGAYGSVEHRSDLASYDPEYFIDDTRLGDQNGLAHTWFTFVPKSVRANPQKRVPLLVFFHGGSDNPAEAAEMTRFHELGEKEGFITVYPWGSNHASWNMFMTDDGMDDVSFSVALIRYMKEHYPVDPGRVYLSGFSNGGSQAQAVAMTNPDLVAAICPIDANWPGERYTPSEVNYEDIIPMARAMELKKKYDYRMPMWYTYGTREASYPVFRKSTQQYQYDFWKTYNHMRIVETPPFEAPHPCGAGVPGETTEVLRPTESHPELWYTVNRFYTLDADHANYYNYVVMHDKGHEIAASDPALGWEYVRHFRRNPDGSLTCTK